MSAAAAAAAVMVQHLGFGDCQGCFTRAQQMCPDPWHHMACAVCGKCDSMWELRAEHRQECLAVAIAPERCVQGGGGSTQPTASAGARANGAHA